VLKWARGDKGANHRRAEPMIRQAAARGARIVRTTECFLDGYAIADKGTPLDVHRVLGEPIPDGKYCRRPMALADELDITLVAGMLEARGEARYSAAILIGPDGILLGMYHQQRWTRTGPEPAGHGVGRSRATSRSASAVIRSLKGGPANCSQRPHGLEVKFGLP
jgi:predicted amidohydrolase